MVNIGIVKAALQDSRYPDEVRENFEERMKLLTTSARDEVANIQDFGESYDDEEVDECQS